MIMSSYFNVQYLHHKMIRIYADIVQNHTLPGVFPKLLEGSVSMSNFICIHTGHLFVFVVQKLLGNC